MANNPWQPLPAGGVDPNYSQIMTGLPPSDAANWEAEATPVQFVQYRNPRTGRQTNYGMPTAGAPWKSMPPPPFQDPYAPGGEAYERQQWANQQRSQAKSNPILADPWYIQQSGLLNAQWVAQQAQAQQKMQEALIGYGDTGAIQGENPWVTDLVRQLAKQNTEAGMSTLARIQHAADLARRNQINDLAARGMLQSGETGYQLGELGLQRQQTEYDSRKQLLEYLSGVQAALTQAGFQTQAGLGQAAFDATQRQSGRL